MFKSADGENMFQLSYMGTVFCGRWGLSVHVDKAVEICNILLHMEAMV